MGRAKMKATIQLPSGIPRHSENVSEAEKSEENKELQEMNDANAKRSETSASAQRRKREPMQHEVVEGEEPTKNARNI